MTLVKNISANPVPLGPSGKTTLAAGAQVDKTITPWETQAINEGRLQDLSGTLQAPGKPVPAIYSGASVPANAPVGSLFFQTDANGNLLSIQRVTS